MTGRELHLVVPGSLRQLSGGSIYDARMARGLRQRGWSVVVHEVATGMVGGGVDVRRSLADTLPRIADAVPVVIDGLAMRGSDDAVHEHVSRLDVLALVHLLAIDDPSLESSLRARLHELEWNVLTDRVGVIATGRATTDRLRAGGVDADRMRTVPPGVERAPVAAGPAHGGPPNLLCVAAVTPGKGQDVLVRALGRLGDAPWTCTFAGSLTRSPAYARSVKALVEQAGLAGRIGFQGECDAATLDRLYGSSSIFVLPSYHESYGMALTEAMSHGLPIVSSVAGAIPDTVPAGAGILVPPGDDVALAGALRSLLIDAAGEPGSASARRAAIGAAALQHAASLPTWDQAVDDFAAAVTALLRTLSGARDLGTARRTSR